jgi:hypothetical protein
MRQFVHSRPKGSAEGAWQFTQRRSCRSCSCHHSFQLSRFQPKFPNILGNHLALGGPSTIIFVLLTVLPEPSSRPWATETTHGPPLTHRRGARPHWQQPTTRWERAAVGRPRGGLHQGASGLPSGAAQRAGRQGYGVNFRTGIAAQRERTKTPALGQNVRPPSLQTLAQVGNFSSAWFALRNENETPLLHPSSGGLARFDS